MRASRLGGDGGTDVVGGGIVRTMCGGWPTTERVLSVAERMTASGGPAKASGKTAKVAATCGGTQAPWVCRCVPGAWRQRLYVCIIPTPNMSGGIFTADRP